MTRIHWLLSTLAITLFLVAGAVQADEWETTVDGERAYNEVQALLAYKRGQAEEVESIFYGLRDRLYVIQPKRRTAYDNNLLTPTTVTYAVAVTAKYHGGELDKLKNALQDAQYLDQGEHEIEFRFPAGATRTIKLYDEVLPTYETLVKGGYAFEARAVLIDTDQTLLAVADNSLLVSTAMTKGGGLDLSSDPRLQTYTRLDPPDFSKFLQGAPEDSAELRAFVARWSHGPVYQLSDAQLATFYSLPLELLKRVEKCRVLRDSDELLLYKQDDD